MSNRPIQDITAELRDLRRALGPHAPDPRAADDSVWQRYDALLIEAGEQLHLGVHRPALRGGLLEPEDRDRLETALTEVGFPVT